MTLIILGARTEGSSAPISARPACSSPPRKSASWAWSSATAASRRERPDRGRTLPYRDAGDPAGLSMRRDSVKRHGAKRTRRANGGAGAPRRSQVRGRSVIPAGGIDAAVCRAAGLIYGPADCLTGRRENSGVSHGGFPGYSSVLGFPRGAVSDNRSRYSTKFSNITPGFSRRARSRASSRSFRRRTAGSLAGFPAPRRTGQARAHSQQPGVRTLYRAGRAHRRRHRRRGRGPRRSAPIPDGSVRRAGRRTDQVS